MAADWGNVGIEEFGNFKRIERSESLFLVHPGPDLAYRICDLIHLSGV